jgi:hypothetical protein
MGMQRSPIALIITVLFTAERPLADKKALTTAISQHTTQTIGIWP